MQVRTWPLDWTLWNAGKFSQAWAVRPIYDCLHQGVRTTIHEAAEHGLSVEGLSDLPTAMHAGGLKVRTVRCFTCLSAQVMFISASREALA